jgi:hypothetical protein
MTDQARTVLDIDVDLASDLAGTHKATRSEAATLVSREAVEQDLAAVQRHGYVIIPALLSRDECQEIRKAVTPLLGEQGRNAFEGSRTQRLYGVLEKTRAVDRLVDHPRVLALLDRMFLPNYLISQVQAINILPGEKAQPLHYDDGFYQVPRPRPPLGAATVWAIDDFSADNGATTLVPESHGWPGERIPGAQDPRIQAIMPAGSVVFYPGTLWHGGGANHSDHARLALTCQYCEPWLRTQENMFLAVSRDTARSVSEDIRRMLGYSIHPPFMGMVNGMHPKRLL